MNKTYPENETSFLAQNIADKMTVEFSKNNASDKYLALTTLKVIVNEADNSDSGIYYQYQNNGLAIIINNIPSLMKHGSDFSQEGMISKLLGLAERYTDDDGNYIVRVLTTHDLNSAVIENVSTLLDLISYT